MKTIEEHNADRFRVLEKVGTGVQCPQCGDELIETNPGVILTSYPEQKRVHCQNCKYSNCILA
jgi:ribosomal protein S27E